MQTTSFSQLDDQESLSFYQSKNKGKSLTDDRCIPILVKSHGALEGSDQVAWVYFARLSEYQMSFQLNDEQFTQSSTIFSTKDQIDSLRKIMGLNISDVATVLRVSRPTVYQWFESEIAIRSNHQKRLNDIYDICLFWSRKKIGYLNPYLYKKLNNLGKSLIETLTEEKLNKNEIHYFLNQIEQLILLKEAEKDKNKYLLEQYGFEEVNEEELEKNFKANIQTIG